MCPPGTKQNRTWMSICPNRGQSSLSRFILLSKNFVQVQSRFFLVEPEPEACPRNMEEVGGTVIGKRGGNRSGRGGEGGRARSAGLRRCSSANTAVPVPPSPPLSSPHTTASLTLASMSMTAPTTPMLVSGDAEEVKDSTGSRSVRWLTPVF